MSDAAGRAREYYRALDQQDYDALAALLSPEFVQERPDVTLAGRDRFVRFMREDRPRTDTTHEVETVFVASGDAADAVPDGGSDDDPSDDNGDNTSDRRSAEVAVRGRLLLADGSLLTRFVDVFTVGDDGFERLDTYTK